MTVASKHLHRHLEQHKIKMNFDSNIILAKPSGVTLEQHIFDVMTEADMILSSSPFVLEKYSSFVGKDLHKRLEVVCKLHDDGKKHPKWQDACRKDYEAFLEKKHHDKSTKPEGVHIQNAGIRHEFQSLIFNDGKKMPLALQCAIAAHHSKLGFAFEERWINEGAKKYWDKFRRESNRIIETNSIENSTRFFYEFSGLRGLLQLSDHRASAKEDGEQVPEITTFEYKFPHKEKRGVQKLVEAYWQNDLLLVRAPTGAGKTDASLLWAAKQIESKRAARLVIAMPTRFTSNALAINVSGTLSDTGLYHSSAWFTKFQNDIAENKIDRTYASKLHEFARLLQTPITVCTIDHLLAALTLTREDHHLIGFNLANSCLVIDEADFYDDFTTANILVLLKILNRLKVPVLIMSASLPQSSIKMYKTTGYNVDSIAEDDSDNERKRFKINAIREYEDLSEIEDLLNLCAEKKTAIIYANTVDKAVKIYRWFENCGKKDINPILYHARYTEPDKMQKEHDLIEALGKKAWEENRANGIAILTQIGEMSINICADIMISDICPIDRLTQRAGRLCRFDKNKIGELYVIVPKKNGELYPAPYGSFDRKNKKWNPCKALTLTMNGIKATDYSANDLVGLINSVYSEDYVFSTAAQSNADLLRDHFVYNWLINPLQKIDADEEETNLWKSRDIDTTGIVYVAAPTQYYFDKLSFQAWKISNSVEMPLYLIKQGEKNNRVDYYKVRVGMDEEKICVIRNGFYNYDIGVDFYELTFDVFLE